MSSPEQKKLSSLNFHNTLGGEGLAALTTKKYDKAILHQVESMLNKGQKILDVGCGYGRISLPLLIKGYDIHGIDLNKGYIRQLRRQLSTDDMKARFSVADMCDLPFGEDTFDVVLCLWSVFDELLRIEDQVKAIREMHRVLQKGGFAFIEGHLYEEPTTKQMRKGYVGGEDGRVVRHDVAGGQYFIYNHDTESLKGVLTEAGIEHFSVSEEWFGWRDRLIVKFFK